jgi:ferredoxin
VGIRPKPLRSRLLAIVPSIAALYMFAWPFVVNFLSGRGTPPPHLALEKQDFWATFPPWPVALATFLVCGFAIVYFLGAKGFCTYGCPYGAIFGLVDRFAVGRIRVTDACEGCAHCTATCTSNVIVHEEVRTHGMVVDPGCMKCLDCVSVCPKGALYFGFGPPSLAKKASGRARASFRFREELILGVLFLATFFAVRGLYGVIPFLLALGLAGILSYSFFALLPLASRADTSFVGQRLKAGGRLTRRGVAFVLVMIGIGVLTVHCALVKFHSWSSARMYSRTEELQLACLLDPSRQPAGEERSEVESALSSARFVERYGLLSTPQNRLQMAWFSLLDGQPQEFEKRLGALASTPDGRHHNLDLGRFLEARGRRDEAIAAYRAGLHPQADPAAHDHLAKLLLSAGRPEEALDVYRQAVEWNPDNPNLVFNLGIAQASLFRIDDATTSFRRVLELDPGRAEAREILADLLARQR